MGHYLYFFVGYTFIYDAVYDTEAETGGSLTPSETVLPRPPPRGSGLWARAGACGATVFGEFRFRAREEQGSVRTPSGREGRSEVSLTTATGRLTNLGPCRPWLD